ncbi:MAG: hypothetical protein BGO69_12875 [Bacteroidetes bacterium 46-16]|nr:MAG: hypothetical protein BGO69_12875 [Bacteroidetes bacterium 46-16]
MIQKLTLTIITLLASTFLAFAQNGTIEGIVKDGKNGETLIGATVALTGTQTFSTITNVDGDFSISAAPGNYSLKIQYLGYKVKVIEDIVIISGVKTPVNVTLETDNDKTLGEVVIRSSIKKETINSLIAFQKNTNTVAQVISAEAISRSPDKNTGEALKRISSASLVDGKYLVVRGLGDRYNQAMLNGALLSSTEADRKTFSFDLFPAGMIDNIIVNKAATPDMPGEFAGGLIQINTKDIPSDNFFNIQLGTGSNSQTIGKDFYTSKGGKLDWLGLDDGTRALPSTYPSRAGMSKLSATDRYALAKEFSNNWSYDKKSAPLNANVQASGGFNTRLFNKRFGSVLALNYNKQNAKTEYTRALYAQSGTVQKILDYKEEGYSENVLWGALANFTMELDGNNKISFKNIFNVNSDDNTLLRTGRNNDYGADIKAYQLAFKSTKFLTSQLIGSHFLPKAKVKVNWTAGYVSLNESVPDLRRMEYRRTDGDPAYSASVQTLLPALSYASRFYSELRDNIFMGNIDFSRPFELWGNSHTIKAGYMVQNKDRTFTSRPIGMVDGNNDLLKLPNDQIFAPENIGLGKFNINELTDKDYDYTAGSFLNAGYLMLNNSIGSRIKLVWGLRYENYNQKVDGFRSNRPTSIDNTVGDFLPSLNLTYKLNEKTNLRVSASQTVIRPEFRELSPFAFYDFELLGAVRGNPDLKRTKITNLDVRYELYPRAGELITFGAFYKHFTNTIEQFYNETGVATSSYTFGNAPSATGYGVELEVRKKLDFILPLLSPLTFFANGSYIYNKVNFDIVDLNGNEVKADRPMQGQSPYVLNAGIQFDAEKTGTSATALFNVIGRRIFVVGNNQNPNIWEAPRPTLDFQVAQKLLKTRAEIKMNISNILNQKANFYQDKNDNGKYDASSDFLRISKLSGFGMSLSFAYKF